MGTSLTAIVGSTSYDLSDGAVRYHIANDGLGMAPVERLTERGPLQDGETAIGFRLTARTINLVLVIDGTDEAGYFTQRNALLNIFKPRTTPIKLRFTLPDASIRQIDTYYVNGMGLSSADKGAFGPYSHKVGFQLVAPDPTWYDPTTIAVNFGITAASGTFAVPLAVPISVGSSTLNQTTTVTYTGTWKTFPTVTIYGPVANPVITNETTGDKLDFTGTTIANGDYFVIDTRYGYKTVVDSTGTNKIATLTDDSDLATFSLEADPDAPNGVNSISVTGSSANTTTAVYLSYFNRYVGL